MMKNCGKWPFFGNFWPLGPLDGSWQKFFVTNYFHIIKTKFFYDKSYLVRPTHWAQRLLYIVIHEGIVVYWGLESEIRATAYGVTVRVARTSKSKRLISQQIKPTHFIRIASPPSHNAEVAMYIFPQFELYKADLFSGLIYKLGQHNFPNF